MHKLYLVKQPLLSVHFLTSKIITFRNIGTLKTIKANQQLKKRLPLPANVNEDMYDSKYLIKQRQFVNQINSYYPSPVCTEGVSAMSRATCSTFCLLLSQAKFLQFLSNLFCYYDLSEDTYLLISSCLFLLYHFMPLRWLIAKQRK